MKAMLSGHAGSEVCFHEKILLSPRTIFAVAGPFHRPEMGTSELLQWQWRCRLPDKIRIDRVFLISQQKLIDPNTDGSSSCVYMGGS